MLDQLFIDGIFVTSDSGEWIEVYNPYTERVIHRVPAGNAADVDRAVTAASAAQSGWARHSGAERGAILRRIAEGLRKRGEELARLSSLNNGKPITEARIDVADAANCYAYYAEQAAGLDRRQGSGVEVPDANYESRLFLEPAGVASLIVPWNFPLVTTSWKLAPALAAGCAVVLKPSEITPIVELEMGRIANEAGLPPGVMNIVTGTGAGVGAPMTRHPGVAKISFTGSNAVGALVMQAASAGVKSVGLELGGKSPIIVFADADIPNAVEYIVGGIFYNAGQMCSATSRLIVARAIVARLLEALVEAGRGLRPGDPLDEATTLGPITMRAQFDKINRHIAEARARGLRPLTGGGRPGSITTGWFVEPTVFSEVDTHDPLWREEIFGPVLCVRAFDSDEEAIGLANDSAFGLVATLVGADRDRLERAARRVRAGHVWINAPQTIFVETSWGGFKASGIGRELGPWGLSAYLEVKHVTSRGA